MTTYIYGIDFYLCSKRTTVSVEKGPHVQQGPQYVEKGPRVDKGPQWVSMKDHFCRKRTKWSFFDN